MSIKSIAAKWFAKRICNKIDNWSSDPLQTQEKVFHYLIQQGKHTMFGKDHNFIDIDNYDDFAKNVPIRDYEQLRTYVDPMVKGEPNILWPGKPIYFAKTSGTTSGAKYIPLTKESIKTHIDAARNAILCYINETNNTKIVDGKMIFLQGSPLLSQTNDIQTGRLSGIVAHYVPNYLQSNRLPSWETNCIEDWEEKLDAIIDETFNQDMSIISGIPPWVQMYFERLKDKTDQPIGKLFKNFELFIYGGVNYRPYKQSFDTLIGRKVDSIELYPASEGFFAFQDKQNQEGMLLQLDSGIFYEFVEASCFFEENPERITLKDVKVGVNYVMIVSTTAGLWGYNVGDTIAFTCTRPYRVIVTGRIKHFISAFGEHVIGKEIEQSMQEVSEYLNIEIQEFTVAPQVNPSGDEKPYHEWFIEFKKAPSEDILSKMSSELNKALCKQNSYYNDLITGAILQPLKITVIKTSGFANYMKSIGRLGGQNKMPRLSNDRKIANALIEFTI